MAKDKEGWDDTKCVLQTTKNIIFIYLDTLFGII